jgi:ribonucleoside-diphosphate reductase alpha chain
MFQPEGFSNTIFKERYALTDSETWPEACRRVAKQMALAENVEKQKIYEDKFYDALVDNLFCPGGRIWYNSGRNNPQLLNCFLLTDELDSKEGWGRISYEMIVTSMTGGGCGIDFSDVRPDGASIGDHKGTCPGPLALMDLIDFNAGPVIAGGGRRVALMLSLDIDHPDIHKFLDAKLVKGKLTHANVSVRSKLTSDFIKAIKNNEDIILSWKGKYKTNTNAKALWEKIVKNAYECAEPGFLNWELALSESTIYYIDEIASTNPCGEIPMSPYESCCLGHLVLFRFVNSKGTDLDWVLLGNTIRTGVRFLDDVLSVNLYPIPEMKTKAQQLRRIGLGVTGLGDMLALLGYRYGSSEANTFLDKLFRFISKNAYESSVMLAIEKGPFPLCNPQKHIESGYVKRMTPKVKQLILEHGIRNCAVLTAAPTGTISILSDNCSSGLEAMFAPAYWRNYWKGKERHRELVFHPLFKRFMEEGKDVSHFIGAHQLTVREHLETQKIIQKHIDQSVSKTINMSEDYPMEDMSKLWLEYLPYLKGTTFYRQNTRGYVDENGVVHEPPLVAIPLEEAKQRFLNKEIAVENGIVDCVGGICEI